jgi:1,4-dihydroxy-2-naphthoate octaprenyltransferase
MNSMDTRPTSRLRPWLLASRPRTLPAAVAPVLVGTALAIRDGAFQPAAALAALIASVLIQIGANFANDLGDFKLGADPADRLGPTRVTSAGLLSPQTVERGMWAVFGAAALLGLYLITLGGWPILVIGAASILAAMAYTGGPFPLGYNGLGDLFVFIFFGLVGVMGTYYVQAHAWTFQAFLAAIPVGALVTNILVVNNVRDVETDLAAGKRTLAVQFGRRGARTEYVLLLGAAYIVPFVFWLVYGAAAWVLLPILILPLAARTARVVLTATGGPILNRALGDTAQFAALFGLLFAVGIVL